MSREAGKTFYSSTNIQPKSPRIKTPCLYVAPVIAIAQSRP